MWAKVLIQVKKSLGSLDEEYMRKRAEKADLLTTLEEILV
jgi:hypothetical protein